LATLWADLQRVDSTAFFFLCHKLAKLNAVLGFGRNDQHGAATSKSRKDTSMCRNLYISISTSWFVGKLECWRVGYRRVGLSASWFVGELSSDWQRGFDVVLYNLCPLTNIGLSDTQ